MASSGSINLVREIVQKQDDGTLGEAYPIGVTFTEVVDAERLNASGYSLADFFDNYYNFMKNTSFVYKGPNTPSNEHIGIWIDTSKEQN